MKEKLMNPRIAKEIRTLLPSFGLILAATVLPIFFGSRRHELPEIWMCILLCMGCVLMGAEIFGNEFQQRTVDQLLTQPMSRSAIWMEKMMVLGAALLIGTSVFWIAVLVFDPQLVAGVEISRGACALMPIAVLCTVPFWTLFFQSTLMGTLVSLVAPIVILSANSLLHEHWLQHQDSILGHWFIANDWLHHGWARTPIAEENSVITLVVLYCLVGCWLGYRQFKNLQVVSGQSLLAARELTLPRRLEGLVLQPFRIFSGGFFGHFGSLLKKELRLQFISFLSAIVFCLVTALLAVLYHVSAAGHSTHEISSMLIVVMFLFYVPLLPLLAGAVAVAEEKAWGVAAWHLTLPPSALKQWTAKLLVAIGSGLGLGLLLPIGWAMCGSMVFQGQPDPESLPPMHSLRLALNVLVHGQAVGDRLASVSLVIQFGIMVVLCHALLTSVAIYAGTLSRTTARALVLALGICIGIGFTIWAGIRASAILLETFPDFAFALWPGSTFFQLIPLALMIFILVTHRFAYRWFQMRTTATSLGTQLPLLALLVFLCACASAFFR